MAGGFAFQTGYCPPGLAALRVYHSLRPCYAMNWLNFVSGLLVFAALAPNYCTYDDGDCRIDASYSAADNKTYWTAVCNDEYVGNGLIGGNSIPGICGG